MNEREQKSQCAYQFECTVDYGEGIQFEVQVDAQTQEWDGEQTQYADNDEDKLYVSDCDDRG